jgi:eukaryotic-like serine/threonine-protein kinase
MGVRKTASMSGNGGDLVTEEAEPAATFPPGFRLGKYEIRRLLGAGGMGAVYEAHHTEIGKRVAIKVLAPELAAAPGARTRFLREAQLASKINHPNIVAVNDVGSEDGRAFIVMEFLDGQDLAHRVERGGPMPVEELADVMLPVCSAVAEAHRVGITHRDLKPQNIFLARGPRGIEPKVLDFGISKGNDTKPGALTGTGMIGTPFYFAPEQILDARSAGPASDQYALGVILYECLSGRRPYEDDNLFRVFQAIVDGKARPLAELRPGLPPELLQVVARAMHKAPTARFPSAGALGRALLRFASPRQRSLWERALGDEPGLAPASFPALGPPPRAGRAVPATTPMPRTPLPAQPPVPRGTMPLPSTGGGRRAQPVKVPSFTDLRPPRRLGPLLALVGGAAVVGAVVLFAARGPGPVRGGAIETPVPVAVPERRPPRAPEIGVVPPSAPEAVVDVPPPAAAPPPVAPVVAPVAPARLAPAHPVRRAEPHHAKRPPAAAAHRPERGRSPEPAAPAPAAEKPRIQNPNAAPIIE